MTIGRVGLLWPDVVSLIALLVLPIVSSAQSSGNVGCLCSDLVCDEDQICFNDLVLGLCISASSSNEDLQRFPPLLEPELGLLEAEMDRLFSHGFTWSHPYTQCVLQSVLQSIKFRHDYSEGVCDRIFEAQPIIDPTDDNQDVTNNDYDNFDQSVPSWDVSADPPETSDLAPQTAVSFPGGDYDTNYLPLDKRSLAPVIQDLSQSSYPLPPYLPPDYFDPVPPMDTDDDVPIYVPYDEQDVLDAYGLNDQDDDDNEDQQEAEDDDPIIDEAVADDGDATDDDDVPDDDEDGGIDELLANYEALQVPYPYDGLSAGYPAAPSSPLHREDYRDFSLDNGRPYANIIGNFDPKKFFSRDDTEQDDDENDDDEDDMATNAGLPTDDAQDYRVGSPLEKRTNFRERRDEDDDSRPSTTLMDALYPQDIMPRKRSDTDYDFEDDEAQQEEEPLYYNPDDKPVQVETVFSRNERLDVKKPGPFYLNSKNNFFLDKLLNGEVDYPEPRTIDQDYSFDAATGQTEYEMPLSPSGSRLNKRYQDDNLVGIFSGLTPDQSYLVINLKDSFKSKGQMDSLVDYLRRYFSPNPPLLTEHLKESLKLIIQVSPNPKLLNATTMAEKLESDQDLKANIKRDVGVDIDSFTAESEDDVLYSFNGDQSKLVVMMYLLSAGLCAIILASAILLLVRQLRKRKAKIGEKLQEKDKEEPVKEYKQLCRDWSRSASRTSSNGREAEGSRNGSTSSPSKQKGPPHGKNGHAAERSRTSSTSSCREDATVINMDISTGHMVLAYMEDHLKNKQRLDQEWVSLCTYEADQASSADSVKVENKKKNRYLDRLPYDHNRVFLNTGFNALGSDYINASTIMDHDPRKPAYIVTQGPQPHTIADFWQMIWEQGSVVVVMLTKLDENGQAMCNRYWPEEGSEQYHIYEVHLVSEHVWCDDYMVRSVYLKNLQSGETRTVTQFHFLSWPDMGVPTSTKALLEFRRKINKSYRGRSCPMIIHCSDGVGRSGTYVLIDMVLNRMTKGSKEIDIAATLEHIRDQRSGMVQTKSQFEFCLMAVAEETHAILKALPQ